MSLRACVGKPGMWRLLRGLDTPAAGALQAAHRAMHGQRQPRVMAGREEAGAPGCLCGDNAAGMAQA